MPLINSSKTVCRLGHSAVPWTICSLYVCSPSLGVAGGKSRSSTQSSPQINYLGRGKGFMSPGTSFWWNKPLINGYCKALWLKQVVPILGICWLNYRNACIQYWTPGVFWWVMSFLSPRRSWITSEETPRESCHILRWLLPEARRRRQRTSDWIQKIPGHQHWLFSN